MSAPFTRLQRQLCAAVTQDRPNVPDAGRLLWRAFIALHDARTVTMAGAQAIAFHEIEAWARSTRTPLRPDHVAILRAMDEAWLGKARAGKPDAEKTMAQQEIGPELFDAMFG